jgi:hypothetical protein
MLNNILTCIIAEFLHYNIYIIHRYLFFRPAVCNIKSDAKLFYERIVPFLTDIHAINAVQAELQDPSYFDDFRPVPPNSDSSMVQMLCECARVIARSSRATGADLNYFSVILKMNMFKILLNDIFVKPVISPGEKKIVEVALKDFSTSMGYYAVSCTDLDLRVINEAMAMATVADGRVRSGDENAVVMPCFETANQETFHPAEDVDGFGRLRRDISVEQLAGASQPPPILRPVEMTLVPDKISHFMEMTKAMRHCLNLCVLLSNQRNLIRNSYTLRLCLIEHLFVRVIPLPLPINHPDRETRCFWHAQPMRYETQADTLRLLNMLCRHFATASLSVKMTRSGDATRMLVFACIATICDAVMRKIACDIPAQSSLHYSGVAKGPVKPFGFSLGGFREESEYLKFVKPESMSARTQVLDYFHQLERTIPKSNMMFRFHETNECSHADKRYIDQLCLQMGFVRGFEKQFITGTNQLLLDHYPEIGFFRDLVFMFKLVMVPTCEQLPELKAWSPEEAALQWSHENENYVVRGFNKVLDCVQPQAAPEDNNMPASQVVQKRGLMTRVLRYLGLGTRTPRALPSQANPSILLGERVDNEDDILHVKVLPDFDGTLGAKDCELMLQYLTAPYLRIPLLLNFFSNENRLKALRNPKIQEVLDAALFEPGQWQDSPEKSVPSDVPSNSRDHLCTPVGLLFNELIMSPKLILTSIQTILERVIDMDTGKYSELSESILYVVRLIVKVESFIYFLGKNQEAKKQRLALDKPKLTCAYFEADVRGLDITDEMMEAAFECQRSLRNILNDQVLKIITRWIKKAKDEGLISIACMLHAHLAYLFRNIQSHELNPMTVFSWLSCQVFLFNNYKYDLDLDLDKNVKSARKKEDEPQKNDLRIAQVDLFDMFQLNRNKILEWLMSNPSDCNMVSSFC